MKVQLYLYWPLVYENYLHLFHSSVAAFFINSLQWHFSFFTKNPFHTPFIMRHFPFHKKKKWFCFLDKLIQSRKVANFFWNRRGSNRYRYIFLAANTAVGSHIQYLATITDLFYGKLWFLIYHHFKDQAHVYNI